MSPTSDPARASSTQTATLPPRSIPTLDTEPRPSPDRPPTTAPAPTSDETTALPFDDEGPSAGGWRARLPRLGGAPRPTSSWGGDDGDDEPPRRTGPGRDRPDAALVAKTLGQLLLVLAGLAGWAAARAGRELRLPDERERADVAEPVSAILVRHVGAAFLTNDLVDTVRAAAGVTAYVQTAPLSRPHPEPADPTLPADYEEPGH